VHKINAVIPLLQSSQASTKHSKRVSQHYCCDCCYR